MKTAISISDDIFNSAEHFASLAGMSRSELYTKAVLEYIDKHRPVDVTKTLNEIYDKSDSTLDSELHAMQIKSLHIKSLQKEDW